MKILIVAGPYEADRIRRAAVSAGVEAVAVEPGESLSGWITATRPEVIVLAPRVISAEPAVALGKVRAVPRGRVPILLVGDAEEEAELRPLADGFFVRPIAADDLIQQARAAMAIRILRGYSGPAAATPLPVGSAGGAGGNETGEGATAARPRTAAPVLRPLVARQDSTGTNATVTRDVGSFGGGAASGAGLRATPGIVGGTGLSAPAAPFGASGPSGRLRPPAYFENLVRDIDAQMDADLEAEVRDVVRVVGAGRADARARGAAGVTDGATAEPDRVPIAGDAEVEDAEPAEVTATRGPGEAGDSRRGVLSEEIVSEALLELTDERSRKTMEVPQLEPVSGDEVDLDPPALFGRMYLSRMSGRLTLRQGKVKKHVVFERGHPVLAGSNRAEDRLGDMLVREGRLTAVQASNLGDEAAATGRRLGLVLVDRGLIAPGELTSVVRRHYEAIIYSLFSWDKGAWNLGTDGSIAAEKVLLSLHPAALIVEGIKRGYGVARTLASLGGSSEVFQLRPWAGLSELLEKMSLDAADRRAILLFDGMRSLTAVAAASGLSPERLHVLAWALFVLDRLEPAPIGKEAAAGRPSNAAGGATNGGAKERDEAIDRALIQARSALVADGDYFQILGVPRDASVDQIRRAYQVLLAGLAPGALHPAVAADLEADIRDIRAVLDEAKRFLLDDELRRSYREHLSEPPALAEAAPAP